MWTSEARSRRAWVRMRLTTWTTGASSAIDFGFGDVGVASPGALDRLEGLDQLVDAAERAVVAVDRPLNVG